jgi:type II secretory ATPase GspE/PulE/Tfp pilus assembly ATPase PilB-like protein
VSNEAKGRYSYLLRQKVITRQELDEALNKARKEDLDPDEAVLKLPQVDKKTLGQSLADYFDTEFVVFDKSTEPPFEIFEKRRLDPEFLKRYGWVPYHQKGRTVEVLMVDPFDLGRLDEIRFIFGTSNIETKVSTAEDIDNYIEHFYQQLNTDEDLAALGDEIDVESDFDQEVSGGEVTEGEITEHDSEVVRLVNALLVEAWRKNASDIHIEPNVQARYCSIRFRVDGTCHEFRKIRLGMAKPLVSRVKIMAHLDIAERRLPQDGKMKIKLPERNKIVEFRVATLPTVENQEDVVMRLLSSGKPLPLDKLGLTETNLENFKRMVNKPYGLVLVVGPTGSGKTTTLHSAVSFINTVDRKIWTAEDPVEITQSGLRQVQIKPKIGLTFAHTLRSFLRADPDVIMIGEMRDKETAHIGVEASLTGHLVFSTLHTNTAPETITRLLDMELDPFNFADSLLCVLGQRLIKTLCPVCKEEYTPKRDEVQELLYEFGPGFVQYLKEAGGKDLKLYRPVGCRQCMGGYKGRIGIHELMLATEGVKSMVKFRKPTEEIRAQAVKEGMFSLKQDGILKVLQGITDMKQVRMGAGS